MKKLLLSFAVVAALGMTSCGGEDAKETESKGSVDVKETESNIEEEYDSDEYVDEIEDLTDSEDGHSGSANWDKTLDDYEDYVDQYIVLLEKAMNGDASAMSEYPALMQKAQELQGDLENVQSEFSSSQASRLLKIQNKLMQAAQGM